MRNSLSSFCAAGLLQIAACSQPVEPPDDLAHRFEGDYARACEARNRIVPPKEDCESMENPYQPLSEACRTYHAQILDAGFAMIEARKELENRLRYLNVYLDLECTEEGARVTTRFDRPR